MSSEITTGVREPPEFLTMVFAFHYKTATKNFTIDLLLKKKHFYLILYHGILSVVIFTTTSQITQNVKKITM